MAMFIKFRRCAAFFIAFLLVLLCLHTVQLGKLARLRRKAVVPPPRGDLTHAPLPTTAGTPPRSHSPLSLPVTTATSVVTVTDSPTSVPLKAKKFSIADVATNVSASCPIPQLLPAKFEGLMQWGKRRSFPPCHAIPQRHAASFTSIEESLDKATGHSVATLRINSAMCPEGGTVITFDELTDEQLPRMNSVLDAEIRQNDLRQRYTEDQGTPFAVQRLPFGGSTWSFPNIAEPYVLVLCGQDLGREVHVREQVRSVRQRRVSEKKKKNAKAPRTSALQNVLNIMFDSTSIQAFRRSATRTMRWLEERSNEVSQSGVDVFTLKHHHSVSCCSPGNQVPMYSGNMNGEGDYFLAAEPHASSKDWLWNIADQLGFTTFWSLDNCPDKSARDYHAAPSVDSRMVAPLCLAGVLLSHKELSCLGGKSVDATVFDGLRSFWRHHAADRKFAAIQFITPHEETEKQILELDIAMEAFLQDFWEAGEWNRTALMFWSDHGINFGKYASTHDGEIEKLFPFTHIMMPKWLSATSVGGASAPATWGDMLRVNEERLTTHYDAYEVSRSLLYFPNTPPAFNHDPANPPLPRPETSHIMASFRKPITPINLLLREVPYDRDCMSANIPVEFCTCIAWSSLPKSHVYMDKRNILEDLWRKYVLVAHQQTIMNATTAEGTHAPCASFEVASSAMQLDDVDVQEWPLEYKPVGKDSAKRVWMMPNRDMIRFYYTHTHSGSSVTAKFIAVVSVDRRDMTHRFDIVKMDRVDAMPQKCGVVNKVAEHLCECL